MMWFYHMQYLAKIESRLYKWLTINSDRCAPCGDQFLPWDCVSWLSMHSLTVGAQTHKAVTTIVKMVDTTATMAERAHRRVLRPQNRSLNRIRWT